MSDVVNIILPYPPTINHYWLRNKDGGVRISAEGRAYRKAVADQVLIQCGAKRLAGRLDVYIVAYMPDKRRRDLDNLLKSVLDSMTHAGVWLDDSQIDRLTIRRESIGGMLKVRVRDELI